MTKTVLIADDDRQILALCKLAFERRGYRVLLADNGFGVLQRLGSEHVDAVLLDVLMPEKDGLETLVEIRQQDGNLPVFAMSGGGRWGKHDFLSAAKRFGATAVFEKPISPEEIINQIEAFLAHQGATRWVNAARDPTATIR